MEAGIRHAASPRPVTTGIPETPRSAEPLQPLISIQRLKCRYGSVLALKGIDLHVNEGEIVTLIGANGAGKSTLMMTIFGSPRASEGQIVYGGTDITRMQGHEIARLKISLAPEGRRIFGRMTVYENLQMGAMRSTTADFKQDLEKVCELFPHIKNRLSQIAGTMSGGEQQMLAIGRSLMSRPRLLLLDEPSLGLAPMIAGQIFRAIRELNQRLGMTILLVEQNAFHALRLAHRGYVMVTGLITMTGSGLELLNDHRVRSAYLEGGRD